MGNWPGAKIPEKWARTWENGPTPEMAERWPPKWKKWPKSGQNPNFLSIFPFWLPFFGHLSAISGLGHFPFSFPFFPDFCSGPVSHFVNAHFNRNWSVILHEKNRRRKGPKPPVPDLAWMSQIFFYQTSVISLLRRPPIATEKGIAIPIASLCFSDIAGYRTMPPKQPIAQDASLMIAAYRGGAYSWRATNEYLNHRGTEIRVFGVCSPAPFLAPFFPHFPPLPLFPLQAQFALPPLVPSSPPPSISPFLLPKTPI